MVIFLDLIEMMDEIELMGIDINTQGSVVAKYLSSNHSIPVTYDSRYNDIPKGKLGYDILDKYFNSNGYLSPRIMNAINTVLKDSNEVTLIIRDYFLILISDQYLEP